MEPFGKIGDCLKPLTIFAKSSIVDLIYKYAVLKLKYTDQKIMRSGFHCLDAQNGDCLLHGYLHKLGGPFQSVWQKKYFFLYPNRLEYRGEQSVNEFFYLMLLYLFRNGYQL